MTPDHFHIHIPEIRIRRTPPVNVKPHEVRYFEHEYEKALPPVRLCRFRNVRITNEGVLFRRFGVFHTSVVDAEYGSVLQRIRYLAAKYMKYSRIDLNSNQEYLLTFDAWSMGYFHWMCDVLPRLCALGESAAQYILVLPQNYTAPFIKETLSLFPLKDVLLIPLGSYALAPRLTYIDPIAPTGNYNPSIMQSLRDKLWAYGESNSSITNGERIYVSRKKAQYRFILNEEEVQSLMKRYGFSIVHFEDYSFAQQVSIMRNARYFCGIIGANQTNMMFMQPGSSVLLLTQAGNQTDNCYFNLASTFEHRFYYQFCNYTDTRPGAYWNLSVDIQKLEENLQNMLRK